MAVILDELKVLWLEAAIGWKINLMRVHFIQEQKATFCLDAERRCRLLMDNGYDRWLILTHSM